MKGRTTLSAAAVLSTVAASAFAQGTPPADVAQSVKAATAAGKPPPPPETTDVTDVAIAAGGQVATGNSRMLAVSGQVKLALRRGANAFETAVVGNYADGFVATPAPGKWQETTENLQGKLRYDRFFTRDFSGFLQATGTHDSFQALTFRLNIDPGLKYLAIDKPNLKLWGELGYDFQFDLNYTDSNGFEQQGPGGNVNDTNGLPFVVAKTDTIHSVRAFAGFQCAFNKETQLSMGLEYLQAVGGAPGGLPVLPAGYTTATADPVPIPLTPARLNYSLLFTAKVGLGFSAGIGFLLRYNSDPLPGKENVDTTTTLTLIYTLSAKPKKS